MYSEYTGEGERRHPRQKHRGGGGGVRRHRGEVRRHQRVAFRTRDRLLILLWRSALAERVGLRWRPNSNLGVCHMLPSTLSLLGALF